MCHVGLLGRVTVVVITDMQNQEAIDLLKSDPEIGHQVMVPSLDLEGWSQDTHPATDKMVAINSDAFAGTRVSKMSIMIGLVRVIMGKDPKTNLLY